MLTRATPTLLLAAFLMLLGVTRWNELPLYFSDFDSVNFALALRQFQPQLHQPQPPGYPVYVAITRLIHQAIPEPELVFYAAGLLGGGAALIAIHRLGRSLSTPSAGLCAAGLLLAHPVFWRAGLYNQVRIYEAAIPLIVVLLAWHIVTTPRPERWWLAATLALGLLSGIRPLLGPLLVPALAAAGLYRRLPLRLWIAGAALGVCGTAVWAIPLLHTVGSLSAYLALIQDYARDQMRGEERLLGSGAASSPSLLLNVVTWTGAGALTWAWALPVSRPRISRPAVVLLAAWAVPAFAFSSLVHAADPEHTLSAIAFTCLAGGLVLSRLSARLWPVALALAMAANAALFYNPLPGQPGWRASVRPLRNFDRAHEHLFGTVAALQAQGPLFLIHDQSPVSWRIISYYLPHTSMLLLDGAGARLVRDNRRIPFPARDGVYPLPACGRLAFLLPRESPLGDELRRSLPITGRDGVVFARGAPDTAITLGPHRFRTAAKKCPDAN